MQHNSDLVTRRLPHAYMLQRFIAHYRMPVFLSLQSTSQYCWTFWSDIPEVLGSGLPADNLAQLEHRRVHNRHLAGPFLYQTGLRFESDCRAIVMDIGLPLVSAPLYLMAARRRGIGCVGWTKGIPQNPLSEGHTTRRLYQRWLFSLADTLVVYSRMSRDYVVALGYPAERVFVAQNTIDTHQIVAEVPRFSREANDLRARLGIEPGRAVCGFLGKMAPFKRVDAIIDAFLKAFTDGMDAVLVLAGKGPALDNLKDRAAASGYANQIRFLPEVPAGEEGGVFQLFDVYLSFAQGGLGILEAMAHGRAVVSTPERYPETELLEDEETAFLAADFSINAFAQRMLEAVANPARRQQIGQAAQRCVMQHATVEGMVAAIDKAVECACIRAQGRRRL